jgi:LPXTG-motif cell wall-anchored protein
MRNKMYGNGNKTAIWLGVAIGAAVGVGFAVSRRRKRDRWAYKARDFGKRFQDHSTELAKRSKDIIERAQNLYMEGRKIAHEAADLWSEGRRMVRT